MLKSIEHGFIVFLSTLTRDFHLLLTKAVYFY